ncbi:MAG: hypothetical protein M1825_002364 [Sarcosagium campestre]|nr:MAG: hypothetical protein M1825_002364 [Sarcosagium campestre]
MATLNNPSSPAGSQSFFDFTSPQIPSSPAWSFSTSSLESLRLPLSKAPKKQVKMAVTPTTEDEFEALPPAIQRKYFSTLERLRFAQASSENIHHNPRQTSSSHSSSGSSSRIGSRQPSLSARAESPRLSKSNPSLKPALVSQPDAQFWLSLPNKVKSRHFSYEERQQLEGKCERVILDPADEALIRHSRQDTPSLATLDSMSTDSDLSADSSKDRAILNSLDMSDTINESFRWLDEEEELDLSLGLDEYHAHLASNAFVQPLPNNGHSRRPSFRRAALYATRTLGRSSTSSGAPQRNSRLMQVDQGRPAPKVVAPPGPAHDVRDSISAIDPEAKYYQDPEARLKLRVYLASPQKFDEAIEFGFPSTYSAMSGAVSSQYPSSPRSPQSPHSPRRPTLDSARSELEAQTFLDDNASMLEEADDTSVGDIDLPLTPCESEPTLRPEQFPSVPGPVFSRQSSEHSSRLRLADSYAHAWAGSREMTLRMTLTRPDLRADESVLYGWQHQSTEDDPLALEELPRTTDSVAEPAKMGPFGGLDGWAEPERSGVVKKLWNRVKPEFNSKKGGCTGF